MVVIKDVIIKEAQADDVRKGWVRINHILRGPEVELDRIYKLKVIDRKGSTYRVVLGNDNIKPIDKGVFMDIVTRNELHVNQDEIVSIEIKKANMCQRLVTYSWKHPDYAHRISYRVGFWGILLACISILLTLLK